ncbi:hypothetical protein N7501_011150 [Penicillium viridicatum]|nr:hypothetical protein N7501_011150 [Penicillium viridicatum]
MISEWSLLLLIATDSPIHQNSPIHQKGHAGTIWLERDNHYLYGHGPSKQEGPWSVKLVRLGMPKWRLGVSVLFPRLGTGLANGIFSQLGLAKDREHVSPYDKQAQAVDNSIPSYDTGVLSDNDQRL